MNDSLNRYIGTPESQRGEARDDRRENLRNEANLETGSREPGERIFTKRTQATVWLIFVAPLRLCVRSSCRSGIRFFTNRTHLPGLRISRVQISGCRKGWWQAATAFLRNEAIHTWLSALRCGTLCGFERSDQIRPLKCFCGTNPF